MFAYTQYLSKETPDEYRNCILLKKEEQKHTHTGKRVLLEEGEKQVQTDTNINYYPH